MHEVLKTAAILFIFALPLAAGHAAETSNPTAATFAAIRKASLANGVDEAGYRRIGGIDQWITVRGRHKDAPLLLFLHGGPGFTSTPTSYIETAGWQEYFLVAEWDQRGAGKTLARTPDAQGPLSIPRMVDDAEAVVSDLRKRYQRKTIVLMGHSWGTVLGVELARRHPDWFSAYVGTGQFVDFHQGERMGFDRTLADAKAAGDAEAVKSLVAMAPYPDSAHPKRDITNIEAERTWLNKYRGEFWTGGGELHGALAGMSPDVAPGDLDVRARGMRTSIQALWSGLGQLSFLDITQFNVPIVLLEGRHDRAVPSELAARWFDSLHAPKKQLVWFEDSGHQIPSEEPGKLLVTLVNVVLPLALATPDEAISHTYRYRCGDLDVVGTFTADQVTLTMETRTLTLPQALSGSGARYADNAGNEFWGKGLRDATLTLSGNPAKQCHGDGQEQPAPRAWRPA